MIVGWFAGCFSVVHLVPQILRLCSTRSATQISRIGLMLRVASYVLYIVHAWQPPFDPPLFWMTGVGLCFALIVCVQICVYDVCYGPKSSSLSEIQLSSAAYPLGAGAGKKGSEKSSIGNGEKSWEGQCPFKRCIVSICNSSLFVSMRFCVMMGQIILNAWITMF